MRVKQRTNKRLKANLVHNCITVLCFTAAAAVFWTPEVTERKVQRPSSSEKLLIYIIVILEVVDLFMFKTVPFF